MFHKQLPTFVLICILACIATVSGFHYFTKTEVADTLRVPTEVPAVSATPLPQQQGEVPTASASAVLASLTEREKLGQLLVLPHAIRATESAAEAASKSAMVVSPGAVLLLGDQVTQNQAKQAISELKTELQVPVGSLPLFPLLMVDHEGGRVQRLSGEGFTKLPSWKELCQLDQHERVLFLLKSSVELRSVGVDIVLAPVLDMAQNNAVLLDRICSDDVLVVMEAASDYATAFLASNITPVLKHFPGIGQATVDLHKRFTSIAVDSDDVLAYASLLKRFPQVFVMVSHVGVQNQFATVPCSLSQPCVQELLTANPEQIILTDALDMWAARSLNGSITVRRSLPDVVIDAVRAGNTLILLGETVSSEEQEAVLQALSQQYREDSEFATQVDNSLEKIVAFKLELLQKKGLQL